MKAGSVKNIVIGLAAVAALLDCGVGMAQTAPVDKRGYLIDSEGNVVKNSYNECWRTGYWTPELAIEECDPDLVKKEAPPVVEAPPPPPAPVAPPAPKPLIHVSVNIEAKSLFDFDKAVLWPSDKQILDEQVVAVVKAHPEIKKLVIVGHADRIGTVEYNQKLSVRRAEAGKAYLVEQGIPADMIETIGKGESEPDPVADTPQRCADVTQRESLIACLQPDRRITIESVDGAPEQRTE